MSREAANVIRPVVRTLAAGTQETASFYVRNGRRRICLFRQNSPREVRHHIDEGGRKSLRIGAGGKVIRAFGKHSRIRRCALSAPPAGLCLWGNARDIFRGMAQFYEWLDEDKIAVLDAFLARARN